VSMLKLSDWDPDVFQKYRTVILSQVARVPPVVLFAAVLLPSLTHPRVCASFTRTRCPPFLTLAAKPPITHFPHSSGLWPRCAHRWS
jgi:hypothetical protein